MTTQTKLPIDFSKMLQLYEDSVKTSHAAGLKRTTAKAAAKRAIYKAYPTMESHLKVGEAGRPHSSFWLHTVPVLNKYYPAKSNGNGHVWLVPPSEANASINTAVTGTLDPLSKLNFGSLSDIATEAMLSGFVPVAHHLTPFIGSKAATAVEAAVLSHQHNKNGWEIQTIRDRGKIIGYSCWKTFTKEELQIKALEAKLAAISTELAQLRKSA